MTLIGSLCSGYGGLDLAAEAITGGTTAWHSEYDDAPSKVLAVRWPGVPNHRDLTTLAWADRPVDVLTAGYPCQPFSGAGKRLGTDDPRHLFPYIARGVDRMRPALLLLENVRGHLSLGFDVVLAELDRIGYDARWTLLRAADVGACHGRARLFIAARDRQVGGWPVMPGEPTAVVEDGGWVRAQGGLFGSVEADKPGPAGVMVSGARWDSDVALPLAPALLPTPATGANRASRGAMLGTAPGCEGKPGGQWSAPGLEQAVELMQGILPREFQSWDEVPGRAGSLMPTPRSTDTNGAGGHGDGGLDLRTAVSLLPTPTTRDHKGPNQRGDDSCLHGALLLTPTGADSNSSGGSQPEYVTLTDAVVRTDLGRQDNPRHLLPTPAVNDMGAGKTVEAWDAWTEAQRQKHGNGNGHGPSLHIEAARLALLPTPAAQEPGGSVENHLRRKNRLDGGNRTTPTHLGYLPEVLAGSDSRWGVYAAAVARAEAASGRSAPDPTEPGRNGQPRLSPRFVEWMMMLPDGWVVDLLGRNPALKALGNGVVPAQAHAAFSLLLADLQVGAAA